MFVLLRVVVVDDVVVVVVMMLVGMVVRVSISRPSLVSHFKPCIYGTT